MAKSVALLLQLLNGAGGAFGLARTSGSGGGGGGSAAIPGCDVGRSVVFSVVGVVR
jgi:hypothetical protein